MYFAEACLVRDGIHINKKAPFNLIMTGKLPETGVYISPETKAMVSPMAFFATKNTSSFTIPAALLRRGINDIIFRVSLPDYHLELGFVNSELYLTRNQDKVTLKAPSQSDVTFYVIWDTTFLKLIYMDYSYVLAVQSGANAIEEVEKRTHVVQTVPTLPTNSVLQWARKANILPVVKYKSSFDFFQAVLLSLESIDDKVMTANMYNSFWDFHFDGSKVNQKPKKERDVVKY